MPSVGSTPTTTSPAPQQQQQSLTQSMAPQHTHLPLTQQQQHSSALTNLQQQRQHAKVQQQYSLPLQLQYQVTTTQPSPAGMFISQAAGIISSTAALGNTSSFFNATSSGADISPTSSTASFSSVDTNQTLLNSIVATQQQQQTQTQAITHHQQQQHQQNRSNSSKTKYSSHSSTSKASTNSSTNNRSYRTKYSQFMIITPAVSIDRDFDRDTRSDNATALTAADNHGFHSTEDDPYFPQNGNVFRSTILQSSLDSGNSSDSGNSFRSNYNPYIHTSRQHLLPKSAPPFYNFSPSSWRWCTLICAAMRCFGAGGSGGSGGGTGGRHTTYSSSFGRPPYQRSRSSGPHASSSKTPHRRLRSYSTSSFTPETAFEHFSAPFKARKTRDEQNNIAYEL